MRTYGDELHKYTERLGLVTLVGATLAARGGASMPVGERQALYDKIILDMAGDVAFTLVRLTAGTPQEDQLRNFTSELIRQVTLIITECKGENFNAHLQ